MVRTMFQLFFLSTQALAVPLQLTQQGRLVDPNGAAVEGTELLTFRLYDAETGGTLLWEEALSTSFNQGYYAAVLGTDELNNPLDTSILSLYPLYMELQLAAHAPMIPRQGLSSTPYAQIAGVAESFSGGALNSTQLQINGQTIINSSGSWVGPTIVTSWNQLTDVPADLSDGDDNTQLSEQEVEAFVTNGALNLHPSTTIDSSTIVRKSSPCSSGEFLIYDANAATWHCGQDNDTTLSENELRVLIEGMSLNLLAGSTLDGSPIHSEANHSVTSDGIDLTPASVTLPDGTALHQGELTLGSTQLSDADLALLLGGGDAAALHSHSSSGGGMLSKSGIYERTAAGISPTAYCDDSDDLLLNGGCNCPQTQLWKSYPVDSTNTAQPSGWTCYAGNVNVTAYAICVDQ